MTGYLDLDLMPPVAHDAFGCVPEDVALPIVIEDLLEGLDGIIPGRQRRPMELAACSNGRRFEPLFAPGVSGSRHGRERRIHDVRWPLADFHDVQHPFGPPGGVLDQGGADDAEPQDAPRL